MNVGLIGDQEGQDRQVELATYTSLSDSNTITYSLENITLVSVLVRTPTHDPAKTCHLTSFYPQLALSR